MTTVAWFGNINAMTPDMIKRLRDGIGLTALIPDDYAVHHSGFRLPEELLAQSPLANWSSRSEIDRHRRIYGLAANAGPVTPGIVGPAYDDHKLLRLIDVAEKLGVEIWAHLGLWGYCGDIFPELAFRDDRDRPIAADAMYWGVPICPNNAEMRDWTITCLQYIARHYNVKAIDVDHGHYPPPISVAGLFGCCCPLCEARARELGYDFEAMKAALTELRLRVRELNLARISRAAGFLDVLSELRVDSALLAWFRFRAEVVAARMRYLTDAVHEVAGDSCPVDSHLHPPSIAYLCGQDLALWERAVDRVSAGWGPVVGWVDAQLHTFVAWARGLCRLVAGLDEECALQTVYRFFGYDQLDMPLSVEALEAGHVPTLEILSQEITAAAMRLDRDKPFLPPFRTMGLAQEEISEIGRLIKAIRAAGFVTNTKGTDDELAAMRSAL